MGNVIWILEVESIWQRKPFKRMKPVLANKKKAFNEDKRSNFAL